MLWQRSAMVIGALPSGEKATATPMDQPTAQMLAWQFVAMEPWRSLGSSPGGIATAMLPPRGWQTRSWCLKLDGHAAGAAVIREGWLRGPCLMLFAVLPGFQGKGLGCLALSWWESVAASTQAANLWLTVSDFNTPARRLYEKCGFKAVATLDDLVADGFGDVLMRKQLKSARPAPTAS
jgi:diamine N-acetyltransferase